MKLKQYIKKLQEIAEKYPNIDVIYSCDDEGNRYGEVGFSPSVGRYKDGEWISESQFEEFEEDGDKLVVNSVCIN